MENKYSKHELWTTIFKVERDNSVDDESRLDPYDLIEQEVVREKLDKEDQRMISKLHKKGINFTVFKAALPKNKNITEDQKVFYYKLFATDNFRADISLESFTRDLGLIL
jgi:hypothetical protein